GKLVICDDFRVPGRPPASPREVRWLAEFPAGWHAHSLLTLDEVRVLAARHGLTVLRDLDLTAQLELRRPRDRWISALAALGRPLRLKGNYWQSPVGGNPLQPALLRGLLSYPFVELRRAA